MNADATDADSWPRRVRMPALAELPPEVQEKMKIAIGLLAESATRFADRYLSITRLHIPDYDKLDDAEIHDSALAMMESVVSELNFMRIPDEALRERVEQLAIRRTGQGVPVSSLAQSYRLGSREMLTIIDEVAAQADLPSDLLLAIHDSTWEFANEAAGVFSRTEHEAVLASARLDAERRATLVSSLLQGTASVDAIHRELHLFGLDRHQEYRAFAAPSQRRNLVQRGIAEALSMPVDRIMMSDIDGLIAGLLPASFASTSRELIGVGEPARLEELATSFEDAKLVLTTAEGFTLTGPQFLTTMGPKVLAFAADPAVTRARLSLFRQHFTVLRQGKASHAEIEKTVRVYLSQNQKVSRTAQVLRVHDNTVRYRINRFQELTRLELGRTEDLVTAWWLLNTLPIFSESAQLTRSQSSTPRTVEPAR